MKRVFVGMVAAFALIAAGCGYQVPKGKVAVGDDRGSVVVFKAGTEVPQNKRQRIKEIELKQYREELMVEVPASFKQNLLRHAQDSIVVGWLTPVLGGTVRDQQVEQYELRVTIEYDLNDTPDLAPAFKYSRGAELKAGLLTASKGAVNEPKNLNEALEKSKGTLAREDFQAKLSLDIWRKIESDMRLKVSSVLVTEFGLAKRTEEERRALQSQNR